MTFVPCLHFFHGYRELRSSSLIPTPSPSCIPCTSMVNNSRWSPWAGYRERPSTWSGSSWQMYCYNVLERLSAMKTLASNLNGLFAVLKPTGITSAGIVNQLKQILAKEHNKQLQENSEHCLRTGELAIPHKRSRIGHGGTLDSNASGVLVIGVGRGTKLLASQLKGNKQYRAVGCLGTSTDTQDALGKVTHRSPADHVTMNLIKSSLQHYVGNTMQFPPVYSALKVGGVRMSDLAYRGEPVSPKPARPVTVHSLECVQFFPPYFTLDIHCGGGFYVRQLIQDLGQDLGTTAHLAELVRTQQGPFTLAQHALAEDKWTVQHIFQAIREFTESAHSEDFT